MKMLIYAEAGVSHLWLVDPIARTVEVYELTQNHWLLIRTAKDEEKLVTLPFDAIEAAE